MKLIQLILVPLLFALVVMYFKRFRSKLIDRMLVLLLGVVGIVMVIFPDLTQAIARFVGVGRGVDLITYLGLVGLAFMLVLQYDKVRKLELKLTEVTRNDAISKASKPNTGK